MKFGGNGDYLNEEIEIEIVQEILDKMLPYKDYFYI